MPAIATVIIPAHDEERLLARVLTPLTPAIATGTLEVIVVCNACTDRSADVARSFTGVRVLETDIASKTHAMNLGDEIAGFWPRVYLDADVVADPQSIADTAAALSVHTWLAARPDFCFDTARTTPTVRAYFRARSRLPSVRRAMWAAGVYALSRQGHNRLGRFPEVTADDLWIDRLFTDGEKTVVDTAPVTVPVPRTLAALLKVRRRHLRGTRESGPGGDEQPDPEGVLRELLRTVRSPMTAIDAMAYIAVALSTRLPRRGGDQVRWERDDSIRRA